MSAGYLDLGDFRRTNKVETKDSTAATVRVQALWCSHVSHKPMHPQWAPQQLS
ncbi:MAG: hypothetical protein V3T45_07230 [Nitrospinaceae bacterium]